MGELRLPEGNVMLEPAWRHQTDAVVLQCSDIRKASNTGIVLGILVELHGVDALPQRQQGAIDVSCLF